MEGEAQGGGPSWLERALAVANDLVATEGASQEQVFHVYVRAMAAYVGVHNGIDLEPTVTAVVSTGEKLISSTSDPVQKAQFQWELGTALYDAVQISQMRGEYDAALKYGQTGVGISGKGQRDKAYDFVRRPPIGPAILPARYDPSDGQTRSPSGGRLLRQGNSAVGTRLLGRPGLRSRASRRDLREHGRILLGGRPEGKSCDVDREGHPMDGAGRRPRLDRSPPLAVPYNNLASMHRKLGLTDKADRLQEMASRAKSDKLR